MDGNPGNDPSAPPAPPDSDLGIGSEASAPTSSRLLTGSGDELLSDGGVGGDTLVDETGVVSEVDWSLEDDGGDVDVLEPLITIDDPEHSHRSWLPVISWGIVGLCFAWVLAAVHPEWIFHNSTPTGGDMGAHVWGPDFLMHDLLPHLRLTGWTPDWYAGFPAYVFYMVIPSLLVVVLTVGPPVWATPFLLAGVAALAVLVQRRVTSSVLRTVLWTGLAVVALLCVPVPYNVAFKMVTVLGLLTLPIAAYAVGKAARLPFPGPPLLAIGATAFVFESAFTILGGNLFSTMAGEFAFSISLSLALAYLAVLFKGMRTGREKALGAVLFALVLLCHVIPWLFVVGATILMIFVRREDRTPWWDASTKGRWLGAAVVAFTFGVMWMEYQGIVSGWLAVVGSLAAVALFVSIDGRAFRWAIVVMPVGGLVACFWFVPFFMDRPLMNDMGWEKYTDYGKYLWPDPAVFNMPFRTIVFALAALGAVLSMVHRVRLGWFLTLTVVCTAWAFRYAPQWRLWNARILPFYILALYLLAALAVALLVRSIALVVGDLARRREEPIMVGVIGVVVALAVVFVAIGGSMRMLPGGALVADSNAEGGSIYKWAGIGFPTFNGGSSWALYNFQGLEERPAYPEYSSIIKTMGQVGKEQGCGRAMWEYEPKLDRFGTPMALMLLPYFTSGCIGSMEGLYFEASSTTPFHFINQSELSSQPSRAQRDLPYPNLDVPNGISHLQMMGVKYYMATSAAAIDAARQDSRLTEVRSIGPFVDSGSPGVQHNWVVFEVADTDLVAPMPYKPAVLKDTDDHIDGWVYGKERPEPKQSSDSSAVVTPVVPPKTTGPAMTWYLDPTKWEVPLATSGPEDWPRIDPSDTDPPKESVPEVNVSNIATDEDSISFDVDKVGSPVMVKMSYFPNWQVSGADGPYRVSPNQMVVVPTEKHVELTYGTTSWDRLGWLLTIVGLALVGLIAVREERRRRSSEAELALVGVGAPADDAASDDPAGSGSGGGSGSNGSAGIGLEPDPVEPDSSELASGERASGEQASGEPDSGTPELREPGPSEATGTDQSDSA